MHALLSKYRELILYAVFGAGTVAVDVGIYALMVDRAGIRWANVFGWCGAVAFAFFTNKRYVFNSGATRQNGAWKEFILFISARVVGYLLFDMLIYTALLYLMNDKLDKLLMNVLVIIFNYVASKWVVFRKKRT